MRIQDLPRHLGQHSGGLVICRGQFNHVVPLERASMPGRTVIQWDKEHCADLWNCAPTISIESVLNLSTSAALAKYP